MTEIAPIANNRPFRPQSFPRAPVHKDGPNHQEGGDVIRIFAAYRKPCDLAGVVYGGFNPNAVSEIRHVVQPVGDHNHGGDGVSDSERERNASALTSRVRHLTEHQTEQTDLDKKDHSLASDQLIARPRRT